MKEPVLYRIFRPFISFLVKIIYRPTIIGVNNIPHDEGAILAGNHTHIFDSLLMISTTKRTVHFLAKSSLFKGPKKLIIANMGAIEVDRTRTSNPEVLEAAVSVLKNDGIIGIFPESTINRTKEEPTLPFKTGAVRMSNNANKVIVPFVISGEYKIFRKSIKIEFFEPYVATNYIELENQKLRDNISNGILKNRREDE
jgi:1-acyl-sn-glycerol-3-phosphate acyltransferase